MSFRLGRSLEGSVSRFQGLVRPGMVCRNGLGWYGESLCHELASIGKSLPGLAMIDKVSQSSWLGLYGMVSLDLVSRFCPVWSGTAKLVILIW